MGFIIEPIPERESVAALEPLLEHEGDTTFVAQLLESLNKANDQAKKAVQDGGLDQALYEALPLQGMDGWPTTFDEYVTYLCVYSRWIPHQSDDPAWASPTDLGEHQEVYNFPVGMCQVSGVNMTHETGRECNKGDEFGYFTFGGSDIIVLTQKGTHPQWNPAFVEGTSYYSLYGTLLGRVTPFA